MELKINLSRFLELEQMQQTTGIQINMEQVILDNSIVKIIKTTQGVQVIKK